MSEQLWYTWSTSGFGTATGFRVRAASENLKDVEGQRVRAFVNLVRYTLSQDVDPFLPPQEAPLCLAFLKAGPGQESALIQKTYSGLDGARRPGAYFSHLIADLPPVPSRHPSGQVPFSAREAIALWRSPLWKDKDSESTLPPGRRDLPPISPTDLLPGGFAGKLTEQKVMEKQELFSVVMQAFLTLALSGEHKRLYLAGDPETVATLIWGITHALPRTLNIMRELTFSTFEADLDSDAKPFIVGTCWLPNHLKQGHEQALLDLPSQYYQSGNPYGIAINCVSLQSSTPFTPLPLVTRYTQFVLSCFAHGSTGMIELNSLLDEAEKRGAIQDMLAFLNLYADFQEMLSREDVTRNLQEMIAKVEVLDKQGETILAQDRLDVLEMPPLQNITLAGELLKRDNVQRSLVHWMTQDTTWWQSRGQPLVSKLYRLTQQYTGEALTEKRDGFVQRITSSKAWHKKEGQDLVSLLLPYTQVRAGAAPLEVLGAFAHAVATMMLEAQNELVAALLPFTKKVIDFVCLSIQRDDSSSTRFWTAVLAICTERISTQTHSYLLEQLSGLGYTVAYEQWWREYGVTMITRLYPVVRKRPGTESSQAFTRFATRAAQELVAAIQSNDLRLLIFWNTVLDKATASAPATEPTAWATVLTQLAATPYTRTFQQWWKESGKNAVITISKLPPEQSDQRLQEALTTFTRKPVQEIVSALQMNEVTRLSFWEEMLASVASYQSRPAIWVDLLNSLSVESLSTSAQAFQQWWAEQGREATRYLCKLIERAQQGSAYLNLALFTRAVDEVLYRYLLGEVQEGQQRYEAMITFYLEVLLDAVPAQQADIWLKQIQRLNDLFVYRDAGWSLRAILLDQWSRVPIVRNGAQPSLRPWLEPTWSQLDAFLSSSQIVDAWKKIAITKALETYFTSPDQVVVGIVKQHNRLFAEVLQDLIKAPPTRPIVLQFFRFLAQQKYVYRFDLLSDLLSACGYQQDIAEQLLSEIAPPSAEGTGTSLPTRDVVLLLERYCRDLLERAEPSPTVLRLLKDYFNSFDVVSLDTSLTQGLLVVLYQRIKSLPTDLQQSVAGWYAIAEFLAQPQSSHNALRDLSDRLRNMAQMVPDMQQKLIAKLTPHLVDLVNTPTDLTRVLDNVGRENALDLLREMARIAGEKYGQLRSPQKLAPYVSLVLQESTWLQSPQKEGFIDACFQLLFKHVEKKTRDKNWPEPLWAETLVNEWKSYLHRLGSADRERVNSLKQAISSGSIPNMISAFDPAIESYLSPQEMTIINLALKFLEAYHIDDTAAMVEAHQALGQYMQPRYAPDQANRLRQAVAYMQQQQEQAEAAWRQQQQEQAELARRHQQQPAHLSHAAPAGSGNGSGSAGGQGRRDGTSVAQGQGAGSPQFPAQPQQGDQSGAGDQQKAVAKVNGRPISEGWLQLAANIERIYLSNRQLQLQGHIQKIENEGTKQNRQEKKALESKKKEVKGIGNLINDVMRLREETLKELIDDILIQEEIGKMRMGADTVWRSLEGEMEGKIVHLHKELATIPGSINSHLRSTEPKSIEETRAVLAVLIRRELFGTYLRQRGLTTQDWLKTQREFADITINDAFASKRGGFKLR